jgi:hypothetical protein
MSLTPWSSIFSAYNILAHDFSLAPFLISADDIKKATAHFSQTSQKEPRILCKQDSREDRPQEFKDNNLFMLPIKNGYYAIIRGEGYVDIPIITTPVIPYQSSLDFVLETSLVGNSEMQHLDFAYASSLIRTFLKDNSLVLTIRGRKYTPKFDFIAGTHSHTISTESVQTEVDAGYEGKNQIVLVEAKNSSTQNTIIRQLYYPFRQWSEHSRKPVKILFFEKQGSIYSLWEFGFKNVNDYNSITLLQSAKFEII